jgi:hypothetical protein
MLRQFHQRKSEVQNVLKTLYCSRAHVLTSRKVQHYLGLSDHQNLLLEFHFGT